MTCRLGALGYARYGRNNFMLNKCPKTTALIASILYSEWRLAFLSLCSMLSDAAFLSKVWHPHLRERRCWEKVFLLCVIRSSAAYQLSEHLALNIGRIISVTNNPVAQLCSVSKYISLCWLTAVISPKYFMINNGNPFSCATCVIISRQRRTFTYTLYQCA